MGTYRQVGIESTPFKKKKAKGTIIITGSGDVSKKAFSSLERLNFKRTLLYLFLNARYVTQAEDSLIFGCYYSRLISKTNILESAVL
jgi:hypothetical protein